MVHTLSVWISVESCGPVYSASLDEGHVITYAAVMIVCYKMFCIWVHVLAVIIAGQNFISLKHECRVMLQRGDSRNLLFILCFFTRNVLFTLLCCGLRQAAKGSNEITRDHSFIEINCCHGLWPRCLTSGLKHAMIIIFHRYQNELYKAVNERKPRYLQHGELVKLMKWKLMVLCTCFCTMLLVIDC